MPSFNVFTPLTIIPAPEFDYPSVNEPLAGTGRIWVDSELEKGTTFRFTLPVRKEDA